MYNEYRKDHNVNRKEAAMGRFLNPGNEAFSEVIHSEICMMKTPQYTNRVKLAAVRFRKVNHSGDLEERQ